MSPNKITIPSQPGTYVLMLRLQHGCRITIGKLGKIAFDPGWYAYVGSAFGPGGLAARLGRHLRADKKFHWHVDYLRSRTSVVGMWTASGPRYLEHDWAVRLMAPPFKGRPVTGFGCTDCGCTSHLIYFEHVPGREKVGRALRARWSRVDESGRS